MTTHSTVIIAARVSLSFVFLVFAVPLALNAKRCLLGGNGSFGGSGSGVLGFWVFKVDGFYLARQLCILCSWLSLVDGL